MGCVSSKLFKKELQREIILNNGVGVGGGGGGTVSGACANHVVSLTSSTYGALNLDKDKTNFLVKNSPPQQQQQQQPPIEKEEPSVEEKKSPPREEKQPLEVINTWELMSDLEEVGGAERGELAFVNNQQQQKRSPKQRLFLEARSPLKFLNQIGSPRKARTYGGKENKVKKASDFSPRPVFKANNPSGKANKAVLKLSYNPVPKGSSPPSPALTPTGVGKKDSSSGGSSGVSLNSSMSSGGSRSSFSPLFDPELVALYERELTEEEEQIKRIISLTPRNRRLKDSCEVELILKSFELRCPPGGENSVVIYTTTLRGIRKTFEDCNVVRSIVESHCVRIVERDVSMDSGFKEELRRLMGTKEVKVPVLFVKGRLIGGAEQVVKLEEEGKLGVLFNGIPRGVAAGCEGCAGVRFMMCTGCNGSTKVLDGAQRKMVRCGECNENGLIQCPICC